MSGTPETPLRHPSDTPQRLISLEQTGVHMCTCAQFNVYSLSLSVFALLVQTPLKGLSLPQFEGTIRLGMTNIYLDFGNGRDF